ncbi:MAG: ribonuclease J, partial [Propionibacteriaceae bacterium]
MTDSTLVKPPTLAEHTLRITPHGGHGDVGRNMSSLEIDGRLLLIDCGVLFPDELHPGVDLILPGLDSLRSRLDDVDGLILTHGHEDHIGAVPYLLRMRPDIALYGSSLTLALLREKLKEHRLPPTQFNVVEDGGRRQIGAFDVSFIAVNHSIPDAMAVFVRTAGGTVLHTGDFKMDQTPLDHRITDLRAFARCGEEGVDVLMADSTNAEVGGFTTPELDIEPALERVFASSQRKLIVACFSSHVHRVQQVLNLAQRYGRKVAYVGRSMMRNMGVARDLGYLQVPGDVLISINDIEKYRDDEVVIICTGSQGEPMAALSRIANSDHPVITIGSGDTVLLASSLIPGNENSVSRVINGLSRLGARVVHKGVALVHTSGHASAGELLYVYNILKPKNALPVHGEVRHLMANAAIALKTGMPRENAVIAEDGVVCD